jgi:hypothetical protein
MPIAMTSSMRRRSSNDDPEPLHLVAATSKQLRHILAANSAPMVSSFACAKAFILDNHLDDQSGNIG